MSELRYVKEKGIDPKFIISGILAAIFEVILIVALLFIINSTPFEITQEEVLTLNINMNLPSKTIPVKEQVIDKEPEKVLPEVVSQEPPIKEPPVQKQPDPLFEAMKTFETKPALKVEGVTSGIKTLEVPQSLDRPMRVPESIFEQKTLDFNQVRSLQPLKRSIDNDVLFALSKTSETETKGAQILDLNQLEEYDIPNLDSVKSGLQQDYQALLERPGIRKETVSGTVLVELYITSSSVNTLVNISSAVSPELANIVVKNLKLLYIPDRIDPLRLQVSVTFKAS